MIRLDMRARASVLVLLLVSCVTPKEASMAAQTAHLYLLEESRRRQPNEAAPK